MLADHHPRCVRFVATSEGPDKGETRSAFAARATGFRCTCRDVLALGLAPRLERFVRRPMTEELTADLLREIGAYVAEVKDRDGYAAKYECEFNPWSGAFQVRWKLPGDPTVTL